MMISPECYGEMYIEKPMLVLKFERQRLIAAIKHYERQAKTNGMLRIKRSPSPSVVYQMNKEYLNVINSIIRNRRKR